MPFSKRIRLFGAERPKPAPDHAVVYVENHMDIEGEEGFKFSNELGKMVSRDEAARQVEQRQKLWVSAQPGHERLQALVYQAQEKLMTGSEVGQFGERKPLECLIDEVLKTGQAWKNDPRHDSKISAAFKKIGTHAKAFEDWVSLLPAGDYGSSICGVFSLIIRTAGSMSEMEDIIFEALADIPYILHVSGCLLKTYENRKDKALEMVTLELFQAVQETLIHIMDFFLQSRGKKWGRALMKQSCHGDEIKQSIRKIETKATTVQSVASVYLHESTEEGAQQRHAQVISRFDSMTQAFYQAFTELTAEKRSLELTLKSIESANKGKTKQITYEPDPEDGRRDAKRLLESLQYDETDVTKDLLSALKQGEALEEEPEARAAALATHPRFLEFLGGEGVRRNPKKSSSSESSLCSSSSSALLVNGREDLALADTSSSLSFVVARLVRTAKSQTRRAHVFTLFYFCGEHRLNGDDYGRGGGGRGGSGGSEVIEMLESLIGQLVDQMLAHDCVMDFSFMKWESIMPAGKQPSISTGKILRTLLDLFRRLTKQLPSESLLFLFLDELSLYEEDEEGGDEEEQQIGTVVRRLVRLVEEHRELYSSSSSRKKTKKINFKLLVTCRGRALGNMGSYFEEEEEEWEQNDDDDDDDGQGREKKCIASTLDLDEEVEVDGAARWGIVSMRLE